MKPTVQNFVAVFISSPENNNIWTCLYMINVQASNFFNTTQEIVDWLESVDNRFYIPDDTSHAVQTLQSHALDKIFTEYDWSGDVVVHYMMINCSDESLIGNNTLFAKQLKEKFEYDGIVSEVHYKCQYDPSVGIDMINH